MNRRRFFVSSGALVVSFSLWPELVNGQAKLPGSLKEAPFLDSWIRINADGTVTVFTGKAELGQGVKTAIIQIAAEELKVEPRRIELITADTARTPNEQYTAGSQSMSDSGMAILNAAAQVRAILLDFAAQRLGTPADRLTAANGAIRAPDGRGVGYGELVAGKDLHIQAKPQSPLSDPASRSVMGKHLPRVDILAKLTGTPAYVQDLRLEGMLHARVVRPPSYGARLRSVDTSAAEKMAGVRKVVRNGTFLAVVAEREFQAIGAMRALARAAQWTERQTLPEQPKLSAAIRRLPAQDSVIHSTGSPASGTGAIEAAYFRPYQMHASIGPSCPVGLL
ncbi:MAG: molybdopterin cofactor-binding domain-containing protein, partial [Steroidobacteraceae bacterium]